MSQPIHHHPTFLHYTPPGVQQHPQPHHHQLHVVAPNNGNTQTQPIIQGLQQHPQQQQQQQPPPTTATVLPAQPVASSPAAQASSPSGTAIIAKGDWTKDLVHLAKTAELKKHALTLQLHTAHILSAHASLEQKSKAIQDLLEQRNRLDSERSRLLISLREVNEDRDKVELMESQLVKECNDMRAKIDQLSNGDYAISKADVDRLRAELGQPPMPSLQETLEERRSQYLNERRLNGNGAQMSGSASSASGTGGTVTGKRPASSSGSGGDQDGHVSKRPRGRPKGSKNKTKTSNGEGTAASG